HQQSGNAPHFQLRHWHVRYRPGRGRRCRATRPASQRRNRVPHRRNPRRRAGRRLAVSVDCPLVVLASRAGTNLQAILDAIANGEIAAEVRAVISDKPGAYALQRARQAGIAAQALNPRDYATRETFDAALAELIDQHAPRLVVLAGFMRILTPAFVRHYAGRLLNIHPALLPNYRGLHTHRRVLEAGDTAHGA